MQADMTRLAADSPLAKEAAAAVEVSTPNPKSLNPKPLTLNPKP
jgi:hypothetical protein